MTRDLEFQREDGLMVRGRMYIPEKEKAKEPYPLAIFAHGLGADYRELAHHGEGLAEKGICAFLFDFCGGGPGSISDGRTEDMTIRTECQDLRTVLDGLCRLPAVDEKNVFLMGESLGGLIAALTGAELRGRIKGLILWYAAFGMPSMARKHFPELQKEAETYFDMRLGDEFYEAAKDIDAYEAAAAYAGPVLLIHGDADETVPLWCSEKAMDVYENAQLIIIPGGGHGFDGDDSRHAREYSVTFIRQWSS